MKKYIALAVLCGVLPLQAFNIAEQQRQENIANTLKNETNYYVHIQFIPILKTKFTEGGVIMDMNNKSITSQNCSNISFFVPPCSRLLQFDIPQPLPGEKHPFDLIIVSAMAPELASAPTTAQSAALAEQQLFLQKIYTFGRIFRDLKQIGAAPIVDQAFDRSAREFVVSHQNGQIYLQSL